MSSRKSILIAIVLSFFAGNATMAVMCARLKSVSAGEEHSLALMDDNTLWACGGSYYNHNQLGLGGGVYNVLSLQQVHGENGVGFLQNIATYDAGWVIGA
jgi:alpha-tubulin suppressor-like RCC1 family protein